MGLFILDTVAALLMAGIILYFPSVIRDIINIYVPNQDVESIYFYGSILAVLYLFRMFCSFVVNFWGHAMGTKIERDMRIDLFKKIQTLDSDYFDDTKTGSIMAHIVSHLRDISEMAHHTPENLIVSFTMLFFSFFILLSIHTLFTLFIFALIAILILFSITRRTKMMNAARRTRSTLEEINSEVENSIGGIRLTKAFTNEDLEMKKFARATNTFQESMGGFYKQMAIFSSGSGVIIDLMSVFILIYGGYLTIKGEINIGDYTAFFLYITILLQPIRTLIMTIEQVQKGWSGYEKFYKIQMIKPKIVSPENPVYMDNPKGVIEFRNVTFQYETSRSDVLTDFSVKVQPGKKIALVGETGVGKSTISKLIPRFYDVNKGEVLVDGINVKDYDIYSLRSNIGHVQQDVYIFFESIKNNILYGKPDASDEEVIEAAKKANIHDFIMTLDDGYDTLVGERGVKLSGGQKQRVSIARVFLKNPPVLILDEATSSLDNVTEKLIQKALDSLSMGRTTLVIAHRLSTISNADEILVLTDEGITERGTHKELISNDGYYQKLYNASIEI
jgi:ATP-binding cassette subfamily B protein